MSQAEINQSSFDDLLIQIHEGIMADHEKRWMQTIGGFSDKGVPERGMFVKTGPHGGSMRGSIGWVAQVRLKQGQFGSDNYILCHPDNGGRLMQHSNNVFYPLTPKEEEMVRPFFRDRLPEDEDFTQGYTLGSEETRAIGFLIDPPEGFAPRGGEGASMRMTVTEPDGKTTVTETVFL